MNTYKRQLKKAQSLIHRKNRGGIDYFINKNPNAVKLGKLGGLASAKSLTKEQRIQRAKNAVKSRELKRKKNGT